MTAGRSGCPDDDDIRVFCFPFTSAWKEEDQQSRKRQNLHDDDENLGTLKSNGPLQGRISMRTRRKRTSYDFVLCAEEQRRRRRERALTKVPENQRQFLLLR
jgi:superfamily II DNA or RNA helicase